MKSNRPKRKAASKIVDYQVDQENEKYEDEDYVETEKPLKKKRIALFKNSYQYLGL